MKVISNVKCIAVFLQNRPFFGAHIVHIPFLAVIKKNYPDAVLVGVAKCEGAKFLVEIGFLDALEIIEANDSSYLNSRYNFDVGFNLRPSSLGTALQMLNLRIPKRIGFKKFGALYTYSVPLDVSLYRADLFLSLLGVPSTIDAMAAVKSYITTEKLMQDTILLAPGAGGSEKKWPIHNYIELANKIVERNIASVAFLTGPQEVEEKKMLEGIGFNVIHKPSIEMLFSLIGGCKIFISNDCGPAHIAHIIGANQVVIFKEYLSEWFLERSNSAYITSKDNLSSISSDDVMKKIIETIKLK